MKFTILNEFENVLLERKQFTVEISDIETTPKRIDVLKQFSAKQGVDSKTLIVDTIFVEFGTNIVKAYIKSYKTEKALKQIEVKNNVAKWQKIMDELYPTKKEKKEDEAVDEKKESKPEVKEKKPKAEKK